VNQLAKIDYNIYYATQQEYTVDKQGIYDTVILSMASPFKSQRAFTYEKAKDMFMQCSQLAIKQVQEQRVLDLIGEKDEILFIFDAMLMDYALINYHIHSEEFKATIARHGLPTDKTL